MTRNRLADETSPYLQQHADNPVQWFPWGPDALAEARRQNKPILLSIGYSACHWCHVMAHECFEDEAIARLMNERFVNVKVDREERPDVDELYMSCLQMMTGHGGWPMTMFLTPDGEPFYGGTYFPPEDRHGMPAFPKVLQAISEAYHQKPDAVRDTTGKLQTALEKLNAVEPSGKPLDANLVDEAVQGFLRAYDEQYGGIGRAPKFPNSMVFSLFLRSWDRTGDARLLERTMTTLRHMAAGGIYDHLGGGFHRYSVDERWLVPHFEKMLYDNALLAGLSLDTYRASGDRFFRDLAEDVLGYVKREMLAPEGGFYSTQDADTEGVEGKFFTWRRAEVEKVLGSEAAEIFCRVYDVSEEGNFEGRNILHRTLDDAQAARMFRQDTESVRSLLEDCRRRLFEAREKRVRPHRDEKILVSWNGLMISAFAQAARVTGDPSWLDVALRSARFLRQNLWDDDRLLHTWKDGQARIDAFLDDHAALGLACLDLLEATFDGAWLVEAERIARLMIERFADDEKGGFFLTSSGQQDLIARTRSVMDGSVPSGTSLAAHLLLRLAAFTGDDGMLDRAEAVLRAHRDGMETNPFAYPHLLAALDLYGRRIDEVALVAPGGAEGAGALLRPLSESYLPNAVVFCYDPARPPDSMPSFARDKPTVDATPTAYVCHGFTCSAPVTTWEDLQRELGDHR